SLIYAGCVLSLFSAVLLPLFSSFFFYSYRHPRDLHSFPTHALPISVTQRVWELAEPLALAGGLELVDVQYRPEGGRVVLHVHELDRKSTRLNSSHLGISYAVFCLKKKKYKLDIISDNRLCLLAEMQP